MRAVGCRRSAKLHIFYTPLVFLSRTIQVGFGVHRHRPIPIFTVCIALDLSDHNPPTLQTDRRTNGQMLVACRADNFNGVDDATQFRATFHARLSD